MTRTILHIYGTNVNTIAIISVPVIQSFQARKYYLKIHFNVDANENQKKKKKEYFQLSMIHSSSNRYKFILSDVLIIE